MTALLPRPSLGTPEATPAALFEPHAAAILAALRPAPHPAQCRAHTDGRISLGAPLSLASILAASPPADPPVA